MYPNNNIHIRQHTFRDLLDSFTVCLHSANGRLGLCSCLEIYTGFFITENMSWHDVNRFVVYDCTEGCHGDNMGPLTRYIKLRVAHAPGMPGTFSPPPQVNDPDMHHGTCVTHVPWCMPGSLTIGLLWSRWQGKYSRHPRRMRNPQFYVSGKRPMTTFGYHWYYVVIRLSLREDHHDNNMMASLKRKGSHVDDFSVIGCPQGSQRLQCGTVITRLIFLNFLTSH